MIKTLLAGGGGGASLAIVGQPLDTIKVRIQTGQSSGIASTFMGIVQKEGFLALCEGLVDLYVEICLQCCHILLTGCTSSRRWKGLGPPLVSCTPMYSLCFFGYETGKTVFCDKDAYDDGKFKLGQIGMAGAFSAVFTTPVMAPQERLK